MASAEKPSQTSRLVLGLDTCGSETTLVLARCEAGTLAVVRTDTLRPRMAAAGIVTALEEVLGGISPRMLQAIVVVRGPGSFTGMRIGLSCGKAFAAATGVPIVGVSRLAVLAHSSHAEWAALDANRGHIYLRASVTGREQMLTADEARAQLPQENWLEVAVCEPKAATLFSVQISSSTSVTCAEPRLRPAPDAAAAVRYALPRLAAEDWDDAESLDALYLWREEQMFAKPAEQS
jgi:tRNA threonylcarbamoyladenosine biosynthesis protein TsaB